MKKTQSVEKKTNRENSARIGRPLKSYRQISVTSNKTIDRALELMVLQGLSKSKEKAATMLLSSAANKFIKNNLRMVSALSLEEFLDTTDLLEDYEEEVLEQEASN
ncbi:MAG: hypothetical protein IPK14_16365 [Blastocatellia bacterium]|nr:hypothetical protein [Blastocatellia bacterium]